MPFDGMTIRALTRELNSELINARIDKIYQPERDELFISIRQAKAGTMRLVISANSRWARTHISSEKKANPSQPSSFCMLLRKYLEGGKIKEIKQLGMERIIHIRIEALNDFKEWTDKLLICEFMGRHSNIILVNPENGLILDANKKYASEVREVFPGKEYVKPPAQNKLEPLADSFGAFCKAMWSQPEDLNIASALFNSYTGISPYSAGEICAYATLDCNLPVEQCGEYELSQLYNTTRTMLESIDQGMIKPTVLYRKNIPVEFAPYQPLTHSVATISRGFASMNEACDTYFLQKLSQIRLETMQTNVSRNIKEHLNRAYKKKFLQEGDLSQAQQSDKFRIWGELLTSYAHLYKKGDTEAVLNDFYTGEQVNIALDQRYTPMQNAQRYFKTYNKSRNAQKYLQRLIMENQNAIDYLESVLVAVEQADNPYQIEEIIQELENEGYWKKRAVHGKIKPERSLPRKYLSSDGLEIYVGRNNLQNDRLTLRESKRNDLWLHTKNIPGTHVIVSLPAAVKSIAEVPDKTLEEAAALAAYYSKASSSPKVEVDYTFRFNVKKPGGARPGMVIYDNYWTIVVKPDGDLAGTQII
ncbi:MAG: NFACT RNA binding domain-containing protein [Syntrophomonas sp.]|nr:NFACT RNA binding domain-containing protein [Syntrophomonas sp.]